MPDPTPNPSDPQPDFAPTAPTPDPAAGQESTANPAPDQQPRTDTTTPGSTQQDMGDGAGIRGDYGNASQTNGLEGGPDQVAPATPDQPLTDTELTGS